MSCHRCHGLMESVTLRDAGGSSLGIVGWHCLLCGEIVDPGITTNRKHRRDPNKNRPRLPGTAVTGVGARTRPGTGL